MSIINAPLMWQCECGHRNFNHHEHCDKCGKAIPPPPPEKKPTDEPLIEADTA